MSDIEFPFGTRLGLAYVLCEIRTDAGRLVLEAQATMIKE